MSLISFEFFIFIAIFIVVYFFCIPQRYQWMALLAGSCLFYAFSGIKMMGYLLMATLTNYLGALSIERIAQSGEGRKSDGTKQNRMKNLVIFIVLVINFGILFIFKWNSAAGMIEAMVQYLFRGECFLPRNALILPLGISFYTFQATGYLIDVKRKKVEAEHNFFRFTLFVSFFPQIIQGPISKHSFLAGQLYKPHRFDYTMFRQGFELIIWGLFKKLVISERIYPIVVAIAAETDQYTGLYIVFGAMCSLLYIYTDFSGGVDVARGVAEMLGITMPQNFKRPFFSRSLPEYWRRWNISLNEWWRDYLFYPMVLSKPMVAFNRVVRRVAGNGVSKVFAIYLSTMAVRILNGMWHEPSTVNIAGGFLFGAFMVAGMVLKPYLDKAAERFAINTESISWKIFQAIRTFLTIALLQGILVISSSFQSLLALYKNIIIGFNPWILFNGSLFRIAISEHDESILLFSLLILLCVSSLQEKGIAIRKAMDRQPLVFHWMILLGGIFAVLIWGYYGHGYDPSDFVYMRF